VTVLHYSKIKYLGKVFGTLGKSLMFLTNVLKNFLRVPMKNKQIILSLFGLCSTFGEKFFFSCLWERFTRFPYQHSAQTKLIVVFVCVVIIIDVFFLFVLFSILIVFIHIFQLLINFCTTRNLCNYSTNFVLVFLPHIPIPLL